MTVKPQHGQPVTLARVPLPWALSVPTALLLVRDDPRPFALAGRWAGGGALIGSAPVRVAPAEADPFALLDDQPAIAGCSPRVAAGEVQPPPPAVGGGWFGWLGYRLARHVERTDPPPPTLGDPPPFQLAFYDHLLRLDANGQWWFEALWTEGRARALELRLQTLRQRAATPPPPRPFATEPWRITPSAAGHELAVAACRERIHAGDLFQANICARLDSRLAGEPIDLFAAALTRLQPDRAAFFSTPQGAVASLSPELFLERHGRRVRSAPIKGTRPKPPRAAAAARARRELERSDKDRAENIMIVDLVRNDLGRVCIPTTIEVDALAEVRPHAGVWHLVSEVSGRLRDGVGDAELVRAAFPPGSVSGAPKVAAMNVVAELESTARQLYTGAVGFASPLAGLELSVAIRTFEFQHDRAWLGVGGGIVADSEAAAEAAECMVKAAPLLDAIGARLASPAASHRPSLSPPPVLRLAPRPTPRPDPSAGVFETVLVRRGRPLDLTAHLRRLRTSVAALYGDDLPGELETELHVASWRLETGRLRIDARPDDGALRTHVTLSTLPVRTTPTVLCPTTVPGGLGPHKWADRQLLSALAAQVRGEPLLCDLDGLVLEAARANVFAVEDGCSLLTPPADGRILPGVTRARIIDLAMALGLHVREEPLELARLARAEEVFLTGSLSGVEAAHLDGAPGSDAPVAARLGAAWGRWANGAAGPSVPDAGPAPLPA
ncbi:MAG TPA: aminodeoxychorismate synthase component I [Solirubrobacteraceae bacterium]|nr:aminodeoxychorismate synthase component I [Solirubrobacteraceae bacterium]